MDLSKFITANEAVVTAETALNDIRNSVVYMEFMNRINLIIEDAAKSGCNNVSIPLKKVFLDGLVFSVAMKLVIEDWESLGFDVYYFEKEDKINFIWGNTK